MVFMQDVGERIRKEINEIPLLDVHEHLISEKERLSSKLTPFYLFPHYTTSDLVSSGMSCNIVEAMRNDRMCLCDKKMWSDFHSYWKNIYNTGYFRALSIAVENLFGLKLDKCSWDEISQRLADSNKKGWHKYVLKDKANIGLSILDKLEPETKGLGTYQTTLEDLDSIDKELFVPVARFDEFVGIHTINDIRRIEQRFDISVHFLNDWIEALESAFESRVKQNIIGVKTALAYSRILKYDKTSKYEAERIFSRIFSGLGEGFAWVEGKPGGVSWLEAKPLQDFMMHHLLRLCADHQLPIQIHTGAFEGNAGLISNSNPVHLVNLFVEFKKVRFDLMHGGYPYVCEIGSLVKTFPNVYVDMSWLHILSPYGAKEALREWLGLLPVNKILAFGGDYVIVEGAYGHACLARENVAEVLLENIERGYFDEEMAIEIARKLLWNNAYEFFGIKDIRKTGG